jgi:hypothetical protein
MNTLQISAEEGQLLNLLDTLSELEWRKFQSRRVKVSIEGQQEEIDRSSWPPFISFRFKNEDHFLIDKLQGAVQIYKGRVTWVMVAHQRDGLPGTNWMICPKEMWEVRELSLQSGMSAGQYMSENHPDFGSSAYDDLKGLTEHIKKCFKDDGGGVVVEWSKPG